MARTRDVIAVVEASYQLGRDDTRWFEEVLAAATAPTGIAGAIFNRDAQDPSEIVLAFHQRGIPSELIKRMHANFQFGNAAERDRSLRGGPIIRLSELAGGSLERHPEYGPLVRALGIADVTTFRAVNPDGTGIFIGFPVKRPNRVWEEQWTRVGAHVAAGLRLQRFVRALGAPPGSELIGEAVLGPDGRAAHALPPAHEALGALRRAVRRVERARGPLRRSDPGAALADWTALIDGRWSLVDRFDADGKRWLVAIVNAPQAPDPRALTKDERPILHYVAMGHSNKLIAYELGLPEGTVATRLVAIRRKLGVKTRSELVGRYHLLRQTRFTGVRAGATELVVGSATAAQGKRLAALTPAEGEVAVMAARGLTNDAIARARQCSERTVANLLASVYRKLNIHSRAELSTAGF